MTIEQTIEVLEDRYWKDKRAGKQEQLEVLLLIPQNEIDDPELNGFYRLSGMDSDWANKKGTEIKYAVEKMNNIYKGGHLSNVIAEAYYRAKENSSNIELITAVNKLIWQ